MNELFVCIVLPQVLFSHVSASDAIKSYQEYIQPVKV